MDPYDTNPRPKPAFVGKAPQKQHQHRLNPAWRLAGSNHPYAPFTGNALKWQSYVYDDATRYEGLMKLNIPHNVGNILFGKFGGAGVPKTKFGDRYEGDFEGGYVHGMGQFTGKDGKIYRGEWAAGRRHGCGMEEDITPFRERLKAGDDPNTAWKNAEPRIRAKRRYGTWIANRFESGPDAAGHYCSLPEILGVLEETQHVVAKARMFQFKPDGEVTLRMLQDGRGKPLPLMQDPLHYPHGTGYLAPGPMGQCFALPESPQVRAALVYAHHNARHIYDRYNLDYEFVPGTPLAKGFPLWEADRRRFHRLNEGRKQAELGEQRARRPRWAGGRSRKGGYVRDEGEEDEQVGREVARRGAAALDRRNNGEESPRRSGLASLSFGLQAGQGALNALGTWMSARPRRSLARPSRRNTDEGAL